MSYVSSFYNSKKMRAETIFSGRQLGSDIPDTEEEVIDYINRYCPAEYRMVNGVDSLSIIWVDSKHLSSLLLAGEGGNLEGVRFRSVDSKGRITDYRQ
ncbi:hypothetical protein PHYNN_63 [Pantoea phage Phynn]|nr:hypothetical protein PHYNN_63 [Pantoea phage Phynn]